MALVTYVITVETSNPGILETQLRRHLRTQERTTTLVKSKWSPDNDTISEAYGDSGHTTVVLNS